MHDFFKKHALLHKKIALGLSGGPDSVFLLSQLAPLHHAGDISLIAIHIDHQWRKDSYKDLLFCKELAADYNIPFIGVQASEISVTKKHNGSLEESGRILRRTFFDSLIKNGIADYIALAHHYNDQQETFFIRMIRGTSISGLACMKEINGFYIRPLLHMHKTEILTYLKKSSIPFMTDYTNESTQFLRNRIRNQLIPSLHIIDTRFDTQFANLLAHVQSVDDFIKKEAYAFLSKMKLNKINNILIEIDALNQVHQVLKQAIIIEWLCKSGVSFSLSQALIHEIDRFLKNKNSKNKHTLYHQWIIHKNNTHTWISKI